MAINTPFNAAAAAYGNASKLINQSAKPATDLTALAPSNGGQNFADMLASQVQGVVDSGKTSDKMAMDMVNGKANVVDMVTALSETEIAIESMVTVRDRVISAYEEIMRMPI
ncbi:flagellar hook-basal body complex protein FliE [Devosia sp. J2-20]|jgi:flagellar hook-basal body complex protein FliE|uniref:Flagellar hook-basal body complex protein FliE n=1 Tax=Devosia litorisediminis TaxID=2829817 RepID=A0A942EDX4_9HYPH|nr:MULTISPECIES: flagellar hook-basal body complex protein FliE [Devosia]MBS3847921.1 flagellar hook-basal body complex protein FliE [Devosia litorisediminis]MCZ4345901.1 flagellar hook-basal body complex protein FliE [Devosia neptuniae]WDQ98972.1 flagellar hook-basal body complex protein FliE [Devosia sp. J2-20]|tara:strand:- start:211 stop:546 length:336 start_codon:yes stop_codon:yes gene_type:complete